MKRAKAISSTLLLVLIFGVARCVSQAENSRREAVQYSQEVQRVFDNDPLFKECLLNAVPEDPNIVAEVRTCIGLMGMAASREEALVRNNECLSNVVPSTKQ